MKKARIILIFTLILSMTLQVFAQNTHKQNEGFSIEGHVFNKETEEAVLYATVMIKNTTKGTTTDETGSFLLRELKQGKYTLVISCLGYKTLETEIEVKNEETPHAHILLEPHAVTIDEVVVSANRNETSRKEAPTIVTVLSNKQFEKTNAQDLVQALPFQSGVRVEYNCQNCGFPQVKINGLDGPYTQILIDSRPLMSALSGVYGLEQMPVNMIERVEVVKGGGSALFGANAIAGTINIITKEPISPSFTASTDLQLIGGTSYAQNVNVNGAILSKDKKTGASFYQTYRTRSAFDADSDGFTELGMLENLSFGTNIFYNIDNRNKLNLEYHTTNEDRRGGNKLDEQPHKSDICEMTKHNIHSLNFNYNYVSLDGKNRLNTYASTQYIKRNSYYGANQDPNAYGNTQDLTFLAGAMALHKLDKLFFASADITYGLEYNSNSLDDRIEGYNMRTQQTANVIGGYLQSEWKSRKVNLLLGARIDKHNLLSSAVVAPRVNLLYKPQENLQLRTSYSSGYRAPQVYDEDLHITQVGGESLRTVLAENLRPEYSHSASLSADYYLQINDNMQLNFLLEGFYTVLDDVFALRTIKHDTITHSTIQERYNASGAIVKGVSLTAKMAYKDILVLSAAYTLQSSRYKETEYWSEDPTVEGTDKLMRSPDDYGYISLDYNPIKKIGINLSGTYTGEMQVPHYAGYIEKDRMETTPRFFDLNFALNYDFQLTKNNTLQMKVGVNNIFNSFQKDFDKGVDRDSGYIYGPTQPRTFYLGLKLKM